MNVYDTAPDLTTLSHDERLRRALAFLMLWAAEQLSSYKGATSRAWQESANDGTLLRFWLAQEHPLLFAVGHILEAETGWHPITDPEGETTS